MIRNIPRMPGWLDESPPPSVLMGNCPPKAMRPCWTNAPPSPYMLISNQAPSTEGRSKRYTCSSELLNTLEKGSSFPPARPMKKGRASPAMFLRATDDEKVVRSPTTIEGHSYSGTL